LEIEIEKANSKMQTIRLVLVDNNNSSVSHDCGIFWACLTITEKNIYACISSVTTRL